MESAHFFIWTSAFTHILGQLFLITALLWKKEQELVQYGILIYGTQKMTYNTEDEHFMKLQLWAVADLVLLYVEMENYQANVKWQWQILSFAVHVSWHITIIYVAVI